MQMIEKESLNEVLVSNKYLIAVFFTQTREAYSEGGNYTACPHIHAIGYLDRQLLLKP